jgi:hypothetical protein
MDSTRRGVLATMGVLATAGCAEISGAMPGSGESDGSESALRGRTVKEVSRTVTLESSKFESVPLSFDQQTVLMFSVVASKPVDVLTFYKQNFQKYKDDSADKLRYIGPLSEEDTVATSQGSAVSAGEPVVVIDNTTWGSGSPVDSVDVELELEAFIRKGTNS